ncbi:MULTISPECIES: UPF0182 family protein [unclassified Corynebacterium]|uniref:UPF0182 family protein n=1 Tax=unclassified Corynebacterium TaxID=2624378 RepID=UPI001EF563D0|nr:MULTISPECIES: UPF0182 family protein [unclassified Corynebacterium]MCG7258669.1 UPF0182 family protein [Corynebacterium sp. ACRQK]MCG7263843.1 UPF0182 family protein [Corynebacterium sp. ACRQL]
MNTPTPPSSDRPKPQFPSSPGSSKRSKFLGILVAAIAIIIFIVPVVVSTYTDFAWFRSVDYQGVFMNVIVARLVLFAVFGLIGALISWLAAYLAYRARPDKIESLGSSSPLAEYRPLIRRNMRPFLVGIPLFVGVITGMIVQSNWRSVLLFLNGSNFGVHDPQFDKDLGFYAFNLPFLQMLVSTFSVLLILAFVINGIGHYLLGSITTGNPRVGEKASISTNARRQLAVIAGAWMLLKAVGYWFDRYGLLTRSHETFTGASYTDINAVLPAQIVLLVISIFVAAMFFITIVLRDLRIPALAVALMVGSSLTVGLAWPAMLEQFSVNPNRAEKEREYIARNIEATRYAYGIGDDKITYDRDWGAAGDAASKEQKKAVADDSATLSNVRLLDPEVLSPTFTQQQQLRNFYGFPDELAIDRYEVDGKMRDFVVAARELNPNTLDGNQNDWINRHTVYTHGNGFVAAPARKVDEVARDVGSARGGYPVYTVADLQSMQSGKQGGELELDIEQPRIYFGPVIASSNQNNSDYAIVGNTEGEPLEYDTDASNYTYTGTGGVDVSNYFNRLMFSAHFESMNMLLTDRIGEGSKILYERDPRERVHKVAPWLTTDSKTYPVVIDGRVKWVVDGYTTLNNLPYSERIGLTDSTADALNPDGVSETQVVDNEVGYIRNSVKAVVDAYDGSVDLYAFDESDPVLKAWRGAFPDVVKPRSEISKELEDHLRYPEDMFKVQRELIAKYHVSDPGVFFQNDSFWSVPTDPTAPQDRQDNAQPPYYVVAADPETNKPSFQLITPFRGLRREFLAAHMSVGSDPDNYGQINVRVLPTGTQTLGPNQAQDTMMSSDEIARERTLLKGTNDLTNGNLLTLPVGDGQILYVEPVYSQRSGQDSAFPKLLRVLVSYNGQVGYAPTIAEALDQVGIKTSSTTDIQEIDGSVVDPTKDGGSGNKGDKGKDADKDKKSNDEQSSDAKGAAGKPDNKGTDTAPEQRVRDAMDKVNKTRESGTFEEFGKALDELDKAVQDLQSER